MTLAGSSVSWLAELRHLLCGTTSQPRLLLFAYGLLLLALADTHERLIAASRGGTRSRVLLSGNAKVVAERWRRRNQCFSQLHGAPRESLYDLVAQGDKDAGD